MKRPPHLIPRRAAGRLQGAFTALALGLALMPALPARSAPQAGFDCAMARSPLEKAICADPQTGEADRAMSIAYGALLSQSQAQDFATALKADQRSFLAIRAQGWAVAPNPQMALERLRDETELRAEWLSSVHPAPEAGLVGFWSNAWGTIEITRTPQRGLHLKANVVDQIAGTWLCGFEGSLLEQGPDDALGRTLTEDIAIGRNGALLQVVDDFCDETGPAIDGSMKGLYFRIGAED